MILTFNMSRTSHGCAVFNLGGREVVVVAGGQVSFPSKDQDVMLRSW